MNRWGTILATSTILLLGGLVAHVCCSAGMKSVASGEAQVRATADQSTLVASSRGASGAGSATGERLGQGMAAGGGVLATWNAVDSGPRSSAGRRASPAVVGASRAREASGRADAGTKTVSGVVGRSWMPGANGQPPAPYLPPTVMRAVEPEIGKGVRISASVEVGFTFLPGQCQGGAMRIANDSGRPVAVSFHGPGSAMTRLNGQPVVEGQRYLIEADIEISGPASVGVHLRGPKGDERDPAPQGVG